MTTAPSRRRPRQGRPLENRVRVSLSPEELDEILDHLPESAFWHRLKSIRLGIRIEDHS